MPESRSKYSRTKYPNQNIQIWPFFRKLVHYTILSNKTSSNIKLVNYKNIPKLSKNINYKKLARKINLYIIFTYIGTPYITNNKIN